MAPVKSRRRWKRNTNHGGGINTSWVLSGASLDIDFANNIAFANGAITGPDGLVTVSRASSGTDLLPTSASGASYNTFASNILRRKPSLGALIEEARTNVLLNSTAPVTQTTASLATGTYTLWVNGSGSATSSAGSATITGAGAATNGTANTFVVTVAGTVTITVAGSLNAFQCELGTFGTSLIVTAGVTATRAADVVTVTSPPSFGSAVSIFAALNLPFTPSSFPFLLSVDDGTLNNRIDLNTNSSLNHRVTVQTGGVTQWDVNAGGSIVLGSGEKWAMAVTASDFASAYNGTLGATQASGSFPTVTSIHIGSGPATSQINGYIPRVAVWPTTRITNAQLQQITT